MKQRLLAVKDIVHITGITTRTLHYYDEIELLKPTLVADNGYRYYDQESLAKLQTILFLKEMDVPLKEIAAILKFPLEEQREVLKQHNDTLRLKKQRLERISAALEEFVAGKDVYHLGLFKDSAILPLPEQYDREARWRYGETEAYQSFEKKLQELSPIDKERQWRQMEGVFRKFAACMHFQPDAVEVQQLVDEWRGILEQSMPCDGHLLTCIANTYQSDARFKQYFNQFSEQGDLAAFMYEAVMYYVQGLGESKREK
ncbi:MerR family transcriptional regulator [Niallia circulans]|uniref:MerR family transcriptional regulator n=1 Tax=Shouchella clausii TaxID=79880 RepID=UPI000BA53EA5|nr:MerR family transcriptional regulator [Shouchella clausii]MCM3547935.1 MerR family transcriptional regulator [Shouchella clausii]PAF15284.1 MerR family transcriptional regulator [Shouchella clausii]SPU18099.1 MerR family transcriptional regulator [Niallia circulans]